MSMPMPALVLFDLDDVLVDYRHPARIESLAQRTGCSAPEVHRALFESGVEAAADRGELDGPATLAAFAGELGRAVTLEDWIEARRAGMQAKPGVLALATAVARRARVAILTNNGLLLRDHLDRMHPPLFPLFTDRVFCSAQFRLAKPDPDIYRRCLAELGMAPKDALFIDDKAANAEGARQAGLLAHHFTDTPGLRSALQTLDLLEPMA